MNDTSNGPKSGRVLVDSLRWEDPNRVRTWLKTLREQIDNALAAGEDATRQPRRRVLSRAEARRKLRAASTSIDDLFEVAERALDIQ